MTTKDLMIGDYVTFKDCQNDDAPSIVKIEGLGYQGRGVVEEALVTIDDDEYGFDLVEIDDEFVGIPLTDEILEKNGFKPQGTGWVLDDSTGERIFNFCRISNAYCLLTAGMTLAFQHVHELQHLFRIAGMTREIKL